MNLSHIKKNICQNFIQFFCFIFTTSIDESTYSSFFILRAIWTGFRQLSVLFSPGLFSTLQAEVWTSSLCFQSFPKSLLIFRNITDCSFMWFYFGSNPRHLCRTYSTLSPIRTTRRKLERPVNHFNIVIINRTRNFR